jgi:HEAT repeat protein
MRAKRLILCVLFFCCARPTIGQDMGKLLERFESEHEMEAQQHALRDIVYSQDDAAGPGLLKIASRTKDVQTKTLAIIGLGELEFHEAAPLIVSSLRDDNRDVREVSAGALCHIKDPSSIPPLIEALKDERNNDVVTWIANALAVQGGKAAIPALKSRANDGPTQTRMNVIGAIGALGSRDEIPYLATFLDDRDIWVALSVARRIEETIGERFESCGKDPCTIEERIQKVKDWWQAHRSTWK